MHTTPEDAAAIELASVRKSFGSVPAVDDVTLRLAAGRTTVLLGPSGSGKSTLLKLMNGLLWPDRGRVLVQGEPVVPETVLQVRLRTGYMLQEGGLFPHLTARANAGLMARQLGWSFERIDARLEELANLVQLPAELLARFPSQLSGGQRQRVALIRALMLDPAVLLLDEPLGALDPLLRSELQAELRRIFLDLGKTVVLVTHDLGEAARLGDELVLLGQGRIHQRGSYREMAEQPADEFVRRFFRAWSLTPASP